MKKIKEHMHLIIIITLALVIIGIALAVFFRLKGWINPVVLDNEVSQEDVDNYVDCYDQIIPMTDANGKLIRQKVNRVIVFGNAPFAEDADKKTGMAQMLSEQLGAEVINCAIDGSYMSCIEEGELSDRPMDIYTPTYLAALLLTKEQQYIDMFKEYGDMLGADKPANADSVVETLLALDPATIDVYVYMYDFTDYWMENKITDFYNSYAFNCAAGNLVSAIGTIKFFSPNNRIFVMSPYFNAYVKEDGTYETAEFHANRHGSPSAYFLLLGDAVAQSAQASFVDNLYGSITEANYGKYLSDNMHLNQEGRSKLVERLVDSINIYSEK